MDSSCPFYLFSKVSLSSSSSNWDIKTNLLVVLDFSSFSFLGEICVGFKGFSQNLFSPSCSCAFYFFFCYGSAPLTRNHFWNRTSKTILEWHASFLGTLLRIISIMFFWHLSHLINSLTNWEYMVIAQFIDFLWYALEISWQICYKNITPYLFDRWWAKLLQSYWHTLVSFSSQPILHCCCKYLEPY